MNLDKVFWVEKYLVVKKCYFGVFVTREFVFFKLKVDLRENSIEIFLLILRVFGYSYLKFNVKRKI